MKGTLRLRNPFPSPQKKENPILTVYIFLPPKEHPWSWGYLNPRVSPCILALETCKKLDLLAEFIGKLRLTSQAKHIIGVWTIQWSVFWVCVETRCSGQNLTRIRMMTHVKLPSVFLKKYTTPKVHFGASAYSSTAFGSLLPHSPQLRGGNLSVPHLVRRSPGAKKNIHHLLTIKMRQGDILNSYIGYFQSQLVKVPHYGEDVSALTFISRQVSFPLYKHLLKHDVTRIVRFYPELSPSSSWRKRWRAPPTTPPNTATTEKSQSYSMKWLSESGTWIGGNPTYERQALSVISPSLLQTFKPTEHRSVRLPINEVFNAIKDQLWDRRSRPIRYYPTLSKIDEYCSYHDNKGHKTVHCWNLWKYLKELIRQAFLKEYILTPEATSRLRQSNVPPPAQTATHDHPI